VQYPEAVKRRVKIVNDDNDLAAFFDPFLKKFVD
jgi:hypothetical protein